MFKAVNVKRFHRRQGRNNQSKKEKRFMIDEETTDQPNYEIEDGNKVVYVKINKRFCKVIKTAMQVQEARTSDPNFFNQETEQDEIKLILKVAEDVRQVYDIVSEGA